MDPVTVTVVTALAVGAKAAVLGALGEAGKNAYTALKDLIATRFGAVKPAIEMVSSAPDSESKRAVLAEDLESSGASKDQDVLAAARRLLDMLQSDAQVAPLFDFDQLKVVRDLRLTDIKSVGAVMRAKTAEVGRDMVIKQVHQYDPEHKKKPDP
jgi:hypothetical protein